MLAIETPSLTWVGSHPILYTGGNTQVYDNDL